MKKMISAKQMKTKAMGIACAAVMVMTPCTALAQTSSAQQPAISGQETAQGQFSRGGFRGGQFPAQGNMNNSGNTGNAGSFRGGGQLPAQGNTDNAGNTGNAGNFRGRGQFPAQDNTDNAGNTGNAGNFRGRGQFPAQDNTGNAGNFRGRGQLPAQGNMNDAGSTDNAGNMGNSGGFAGGGQAGSNAALADSPSEIVKSSVTGSASSLSADTANAQTITMSAENNAVKIESAGTYIITGSCSDGNITVKKNTTGVVLILKELSLTSKTGAPLSINKYAQAKVIIEGSVSLTDGENAADETSSDADTADAFDGAAIKAKDGSDVCLTGTGTLKLTGSAKNGIKVGGDDSPCFVIDGGLTIDISAANDGINAGYDLSILSGKLSINAGDDAIHADRILTIGNDGSGPEITIAKCAEGLEGSVVNLFGGKVSLTSSDDGINAANADGTYASELSYSINMTAGEYNVNAGGDGLDSNGNINLTGGHMTIKSASAGGEAGIDYDGSCYIADGTLTNSSGISGPDGGGMGMGGRMRQ